MSVSERTLWQVLKSFQLSPFNPKLSIQLTIHSILLGRSTGCRFLKRQFSLDRPDETASLGFTEPANYQPQLQHHHYHQQQQQQQQNTNTAPTRLYKQNSAGAANDLERIEEVPSTPAPLLHHYRQAASVSLSVESLTLR